MYLFYLHVSVQLHSERDWLGQEQAGRTGRSLFLGKPVQEDLIQEEAACCREKSGSMKLGASSPCMDWDNKDKVGKGPARLQECLKIHGAYALFVAAPGPWDGQK